MDIEIAGKSIDQWEALWVPIGILADANLTPYNKSVGLYRATLDDELVYIGRAIEFSNGGFRKRLSDYRRSSDSARKHASGQKMYANRDRLTIDVLVTGTNASGVQAAIDLEALLIEKYDPDWNDQHY